MNAQSNDTFLPRYQCLHDHSAQQIATNLWRPGEAIGTEAALSTEYRLSTGTLRKAVDARVNEGLLERQQGRSTFVGRPQFQSSLFRFFRFLVAAGERQIPESRIFSIKPLSAPLEVAQALARPVVADAEESLTAQSVDDARAQLLQIPVNSPVVVVDRLARDYAANPLEWQRSHGHAEFFRDSADIR